MEAVLCRNSLGSGMVMGGTSKSDQLLLSPYSQNCLVELGCLVNVFPNAEDAQSSEGVFPAIPSVRTSKGKKKKKGKHLPAGPLSCLASPDQLSVLCLKRQ